jgi:hypothetical protein
MMKYTYQSCNAKGTILIASDKHMSLLIAVIKKRHSSQVDTNWISSYHTYLNMIMRSNELIQFAQKERTRIDWITFYPVCDLDAELLLLTLLTGVDYHKS